MSTQKPGCRMYDVAFWVKIKFFYILYIPIYFLFFTIYATFYTKKEYKRINKKKK